MENDVCNGFLRCHPICKSASLQTSVIPNETQMTRASGTGGISERLLFYFCYKYEIYNNSDISEPRGSGTSISVHGASVRS